MRLYDTVDDTLTEWERELSFKYKTIFARHPENDETIKEWGERLTRLTGKPLYAREDHYETLCEWSKLI